MTLTAPTTLPEVRAWLADLQASGLRRVSELAAGRCDPLIDPRRSNVFHGGCGVEHGAELRMEHGAGSMDKTDSNDGNDGEEAKL